MNGGESLTAILDDTAHGPYRGLELLRRLEGHPRRYADNRPRYALERWERASADSCLTSCSCRVGLPRG